ncbi:unnamed protein product [Dicrocoelium dendriticum]|nr:unnamed protein product [Dicrocoelium dendriticum]
MAYLEELGIVHRDLAARNVLVFGKDIVKVGDVSASRVLRNASSCYHSKFDLPIAWYAPECIHDSQFTSASDAWAYGVTLWEMFTYGFTPWVGLSGHQIMEAVDSPQCARLDQPDACPDAIYDAVMRTCWSHEPEARPTFNQLLGVLPRLYPEPWISTREYKPSMDEHNTDGGYRDSHTPNDQYEDTTASHLLNRLPLGKQLSVRSKEVVYVLAKRNAHFWRVVTHETHRIGCLPTSILTPYTRGESCSRGVPATPSASVESPAVSKTLSRNPRRETVCRLARLGSSVVNGSSNEPRLTSEEISLPRSDFRHVGHVGRDGTTFGNLGFESREKDDGLSPNEHDSLGNAHPEIEASSAGTTLGSTTSPAVCDNSQTHKRVIPASAMSGCKPDSDMRSSVLSVDTNSNGFEGGAEMEISIMNLNFGTSLLDEVFKCFSLNPVDSSDKEARNVECSSPTEQCLDARRSEPTSQLQPNISCKMNEPPPTSSDASESSACTPALEMNSSTTGPLTNLNHRFRSKVPSFSPSCSDLSVTFRQPDPDTMRKSRPMTRESPLDASELHTSPSLRTRWRRSTFNSLTRRSASVSKLTTTPNLFSTLGRKCSEPPDDLNQNKRLTISRPILISKPVCVGKTSDFTISNHLMTSSSSSTAGHITDPNPFTRGNSLTTNTSPMNYGLPNLTSSSVDRVLSNSSGPPNPRSDNVEHSTHHLLSSASIPSSIHPLTRASDLVTADFTDSVGTTGRRLRTLRAGDVVFRAGTNTSAGNVALNSLRKPTGPSLSGHANGTRPIISRPRDLSHSSNAIRSPDYLSNDKGSTNLLSRLDGLCVSNTSRLTTDGDDTTTRDLGAKPNMTRRLGRCLSISSSSSSASIGLINRSPGLSPLHTVGPGFISCTTPRSDSTSRKSGLTNQMASFWGSTFADLINCPSTICSDVELNGDVPMKFGLKHDSFLAPHN